MLNATMRPSRETSGPKCGPSSNVQLARLAAVRRNLEQLDLAVAHRAEPTDAAIAGERATDAGMIGGQRSLVTGAVDHEHVVDRLAQDGRSARERDPLALAIAPRE